LENIKSFDRADNKDVLKVTKNDMLFGFYNFSCFEFDACSTVHKVRKKVEVWAKHSSLCQRAPDETGHSHNGWSYFHFADHCR
jgi:hypothetical protein